MFLILEINKCNVSIPKYFSCQECGTRIEAFPPDDFHPMISTDPDEVDDPVKIKYKCTNCHENVRYWGKMKKESATVY
jgi:DNA-directed RNA polymerase subunit RPC12/RpoP